MLVFLWLPEIHPAPQKTGIPVIASMTTYPPRIKSAWISIETLLRQTVRPVKLLLVLSIEEFPTQKLPFRIRAQTRRGLEILWIDRTSGSYDKLIPVRKAFPGIAIVTFDDDKYFPPTTMANIYAASLSNPESIIGTRGWIIRDDDGQIRYGSNWLRAEPGSKGRHLFTPGGNGCLYPPNSLSPTVDDIALALDLCPTADDIWFWFAAQQAHATFYCLGMKAHRSVHSQQKSPALAEVNKSQNEVQFNKLKERFGLDEHIYQPNA